MQALNDQIVYLSHADVRYCAQNLDLVAVVAEALALHAQEKTVLPDEAYLSWTNTEQEFARSLNMPAYLDEPVRMAGTKIINGKPANIQRGLPRASGLTLLFDVDTARVICIMEGAYISAMRTAAVSALSVQLLQGVPITCMALMGAGVLAEAHFELLIPRLPELKQIFLYDLDLARAQILRDRYAAHLPSQVTCHVVTSAEEAIRPAQLIVPVTTTTTGYIALDWLQPGALLVNVSLDDPLPEVLLWADKVIVDDWNLITSDTRRILGRLHREGSIGGPDLSAKLRQTYECTVYGSLGELVIGRKPGREHDHEIIVVNPFGLALEDIALAARIYQKARTDGMGTLLSR